MKSSAQLIDSKFKIQSKSFVELGVKAAFDAFTDTAEPVRLGNARGLEIHQLKGSGVELGSTWQISGTFRKTHQSVEASLVEIERPKVTRFTLSAKQFEALITLSFVPKDHDLTLVKIELRAAPRTLSARLALHGLKLTRHRQRRRLTRGLRKICRHFERVHA